LLALLTNDDGINAKGLLALKREVSKIAQVWVVAPDREQSASSHSLTLRYPLRVNKIADKFFSIDGTPTDAVMLAVYSIMKKRPDIVISGINHGPNLGDDVSYSGTVAAAMEGTILNIPSIAVSVANWEARHFDSAARFIRKVASFVLRNGLPKGSYLNVNIPDGNKSIKKYKITHLGKRVYNDVVIQKVDPRNKKYFWIGEQSSTWEKDKDSDFSAIKRGYVSITPLHLDTTYYDTIQQIKKWKIL
jgi:5'-nucleotidase